MLLTSISDSKPSSTNANYMILRYAFSDLNGDSNEDRLLRDVNTEEGSGLIFRHHNSIGNFEIGSPDIQKVSIPHKVAVSFSFLSKVHKEALLKRHDVSK